MSIQMPESVTIFEEVNPMTDILTPANSGLEELILDPLVSTKTIDTLKGLLVRIPDLLIYRPKEDDGECYPCAKSVNHIADECAIKEFKPSWSEENLLIAWPQVLIDDKWVYTNPPYYVIGKTNQNGFGITPDPDWEAKLDADGIGFKIVRKIRMHLKSCPQIDYL